MKYTRNKIKQYLAKLLNLEALQAGKHHRHEPDKRIDVDTLWFASTSFFLADSPIYIAVASTSDSTVDAFIIPHLVTIDEYNVISLGKSQLANIDLGSWADPVKVALKSIDLISIQDRYVTGSGSHSWNLEVDTIKGNSAK